MMVNNLLLLKSTSPFFLYVEAECVSGVKMKRIFLILPLLLFLPPLQVTHLQHNAPVILMSPSPLFLAPLNC